MYGSRDSSALFEREDLAQAIILGQVDKKFVACLITGDDGTKSLVLVDQHAADERIRVERFLKDLCMGFLEHGAPGSGVESELLDPAVPVLLTRHEAVILKRTAEVQEAFARWGVQFHSLESITEEPNMANGEDDNGYVQVFVKSVPAVVSSKASQMYGFRLWNHLT